MSTVAPPSLDALQRHRARQAATGRALRSLGLAVVLIIELGGLRGHPAPGVSGKGLGVLLGMVGFAVALAGAVLGHRLPRPAQVAAYALLAASSASLAWLQPDGPGVLGCFVAVSAAALRLPGRGGFVVAGLALVALSLAVGVGRDRSLTNLVLSDTGVGAFFVIARMADRLREGQDQAIALVAELEASHGERAEAAALAERQRVAREMHDVLAHSLSGLVLQLEGARLLAERHAVAAELAGAVDRALHLGKAGLEEARRAIAMLRDEELPGPERLPALVQELERDLGVPCRLEVRGEERALDSAARLTVYRVAQEALTNVRKHARPESVALCLAYEPAGTRLVVEDAGSAPPAAVAAPDGGGYGITGMRERAELLGGRLLAAPTANGFRVELWVPA